MVRVHRSILVSISLAIAAALGGDALSAGFCVTATAPAGNAVGVPTNSAISLTFNAAVASATVTSSTVRVFGRWSGTVAGSLAVSGSTVTFTPSRPYFIGEVVSVMASSAVQSTGGAPLAGGFLTGFWTRSGPGSGAYALESVVDFRLTGEGLIRTYGFYAGDVDADGSPDMIATNEVSSDVRVVRNSGCGTYGPLIPYPLPLGQEPSPNEGQDFDGDGRTDLATGNQNGQTFAIFLNNGIGGFQAPTLYPTFGSSHGIAVTDADADGDVDVLVSNLSQILVYSNNGAAVFAQTGAFDGGGSGEWQIGVADANGDGRPDVFCANNSNGRIGLALGDGAGGFAPSDSENVGGSPWALALGDVDLDGFVDVAITDNGGGRAVVSRGNGAGQLLPGVGYAVGSAPVSVDLGDLDGDGDLDMTVSNFGSGNCNVFSNDGTGAFAGATVLNAQIAASCSVLVDDDRDGDLEVIVTDELADRAFIYRQTGPSPMGVQPPSCGAALRVNNYAGRAGFGVVPPEPLAAGSPAFIGLSGAPGAPYLLFAGTGSAPGIPIAEGLFNLSITAPLVLLLNGLATNAAGEARLAFTVPGSLVGFQVGLQGAVQTGGPGGLTLTNPEVVAIVP